MSVVCTMVIAFDSAPMAALHQDLTMMISEILEISKCQISQYETVIMSHTFCLKKYFEIFVKFKFYVLVCINTNVFLPLSPLGWMGVVFAYAGRVWHTAAPWEFDYSLKIACMM